MDFAKLEANSSFSDEDNEDCETTLVPDNASDDEFQRCETMQNAIDNWYNSVHARRVDLVGDYAGSELFLVEGDSLLQRCFSDKKLDFHDGFQMIHAVYNVEKFLDGLNQRKCNFHIAFFDDHKHLCIPHGNGSTVATKFLLARAVTIRHLSKRLPETYPQIHVSNYPNIDDVEFQRYMRSTGMYFVMAHDGALPSRKESTEQPTIRNQYMAQTFRANIAKFMALGHNVALINGLDWQDTKIMTMVLEMRSTGIPKSVMRFNQTVEADHATKKIGEESVKNSLDTLAELTNGGNKFGERELITLVALQLIAVEQSSHVETLVQRFITHLSCLANMSLANRRTYTTRANDTFVVITSDFSKICTALLEDNNFQEAMDSINCECNIADFIDGRLLNFIVDQGSESIKLDKEAQDDLLEAHRKALLKSYNQISPEHVTPEFGLLALPSRRQNGSDSSKFENCSVSVLPFSNKVFDKHLQSIQLSVDSKPDENASSLSSKIFRELSHWHNARKPLNTKTIMKNSSSAKEWRLLRRQQWFMAEMQKYAASLTNAVGVSLEPETIVVGGKTFTQVKDDSNPKPSSGKVKNDKNAKKQAMLAGIAADFARRDEASAEKIIKAWHVVCKQLCAEHDLEVQYVLAKEYSVSLKGNKLDIIGPEVELFMLNTLVTIWADNCQHHNRHLEEELTSMIFDIVNQLSKHQKGISRQIVKAVEEIQVTMKLPQIFRTQSNLDRSLPFKPRLPIQGSLDISVRSAPQIFQLQMCGPYLDRSVDSEIDSRVPFAPDGWQRKVLDEIDAKNSLLVVAPTSAGKTFISFYAMKQVLEADDDGVLVYVAPTKALVNQIAAEIQARFSKSFKRPGKSVWAIHTRDYRINNPIGCQVLVTVPHILQIMMLAPGNANNWSNRVKRIIFDEVHCIGQAEDGLVWEQLLLLSPCPIIALSATVGNPKEFNEWLTSTQKAQGNKMKMIEHPYRYSDLRKFVYMPPPKFESEKLLPSPVISPLGLDRSEDFTFMHPVASLMNKVRGVPKDLHLEPRDCLKLWTAMKKYATTQHPLDHCLDPTKFLPNVVHKLHVLEWESKLKKVLQDWMVDEASPFDDVVQELGGRFFQDEPPEIHHIHTPNSGSQARTLSQEEIVETTLPLLSSLHSQGALPAILFNYDRSACENICQRVLEQLAKSESAFKGKGSTWKKKIEKFDEWKKAEEKKSTKKDLKKVSKKKGSRGKGDQDDDERASRLENQMSEIGMDTNPFASFDPDAPIDEFSFANRKRLSPSELDEYLSRLRQRGVSDWLGDALKRGIGVHHAGMNLSYRRVVEILFRKGFLRVVIATGTLALGINMPTRTVVFSGDSVFLTALNYRQASGRAGRRGFDVLGNVVFHGISTDKVCRLVSSRLPDLHGHFPITTTLVLRLCTLLHESNNSSYAVRSIDSLLLQSRLFMGSSERKAEVLHHLRFSIEYLRRQHLLSSNGAPLNFAGLVSHLYFTENSAFAFHALLKEGYIHELCSSIEEQPEQTVDTLMLVLAHIFGRHECRQFDQEFIQETIKRSPSMVFLPKLPEKAYTALKRHNAEIKNIFEAYVSTYVDQHIQNNEHQLPLTKTPIGGKASFDNSLTTFCPPTKMRSPFVAISGWDDDFDSVQDLCRTVRHDGVFLEEAVVPHIDIYPDDLDRPLNAYLYDFFRHGDVVALEKANGVRKGDVWFVLNDFSLVLATIITSLQGFMRATNNDMDMMDLNGALDAHEDAKEQSIADASAVQADTASDSKNATSRTENKVQGKGKGKKLESWDLSEEDEPGDVMRNKSGGPKPERHASESEVTETKAEAVAWEENGSHPLLKVLVAFQKLNDDFNAKFKAMWA